MTHLLLVLALITGSPPLAPGALEPSHASQLVTVESLKTEPARFDKRQVEVYAYANVQFEIDTLCPAPEPRYRGDCLWLEFDDGPYETDQDMARYDAARKRWEAYSGRYIRLRGTFDMENSGHLGCCSGAIGHITDVSVAASPIPARRWRTADVVGLELVRNSSVGTTLRYSFKAHLVDVTATYTTTEGQLEKQTTVTPEYDWAIIDGALVFGEESWSLVSADENHLVVRDRSGKFMSLLVDHPPK